MLTCNLSLYSSLDHQCFISWLKTNPALMEYLYETLCPMQWITYPRLEKLNNQMVQIEQKVEGLTTRNHSLASLQSVSVLLYETSRGVSSMIAEEKPLVPPPRKKNRRCFCFGCRKDHKESDTRYSFEKYISV